MSSNSNDDFPAFEPEPCAEPEPEDEDFTPCLEELADDLSEAKLHEGASLNSAWLFGMEKIPLLRF